MSYSTVLPCLYFFSSLFSSDSDCVASSSIWIGFRLKAEMRDCFIYSADSASSDTPTLPISNIDQILSSANENAEVLVVRATRVAIKLIYEKDIALVFSN